MTDFTDLASSVICDITNDDGDLRSMEYGKRQIAEALRAADQAGYLRGLAECEAIAEDYRARAIRDGGPIPTMIAGAAHVIRNHIHALRVNTCASEPGNSERRNNKTEPK